jgi:hypothetical protein
MVVWCIPNKSSKFPCPFTRHPLDCQIADQERCCRNSPLSPSIPNNNETHGDFVRGHGEGYGRKVTAEIFTAGLQVFLQSPCFDAHVMVDLESSI